MRYHFGAAIMVVACMLSIGSPVVAQDAAREAMRKEVEAKRKEKEAMFARMRAMAPAPVVQAPLVVWDEVVVRRPGVRVTVANNVMLELVQMESSPTLAAASDIDDDVADEAPLVVAPARRVWVAVEGTFDSSLFGALSDSPAERARLEGILERLINFAEQTNQITLTPAQRRKLRLAGRGDIKHFYDQVFQGRRRFESLRTDLRECQILLGGLQPLQGQFHNGPFHSNSLYAKTLSKIRDELRNGGREPK
jgi:hypothetical protein